MSASAASLALLLLSLGASLSTAIRSDQLAGVEVQLQEEEESRFPSCSVVAQETFPGGCNESETRVACYSLRAIQTTWDNTHQKKIKIPWVCFTDVEAANVTESFCSRRPWVYEYTHGGKKEEVEDYLTYRGACSFPVLEKESAPAGPAQAASGNATPSPNATWSAERSPRSVACSIRPYVALAALGALQAVLYGPRIV
mmetsp:Transcript_37528/g.85316  ORF Transcript_37528/g.85316 Transcript_37528/m.85316 type:complete len:199 (-) Transcript_37528:58-654(-)